MIPIIAEKFKDTIERTNSKPVVFGMYAIKSSGKSILIKQLGEELEAESFSHYDGSNMLASTVPGM
jgi:nicotinamide riboside kinase